MTVLQAPIDLSSATRVGPRVFRKQVLAKRTIDYPTPDGGTQRVVFDDEYLRDLASAYNEGAYDLVPFQLADGANRHNEDPRQYGGRVLGAEVTPDGLDLILELSEEAAELVDRTGGRLGVSARIKSVRHVDGRSFKRAIRHVLGTLDPRMQNLRPWEPVVDLATEADDGPVIDLTGYPYTQEGVTMPLTIDLSTLSDEQYESLAGWADEQGIDLAEHVAEADDEPDMAGDDEQERELEDGEGELDDDELDAEADHDETADEDEDEDGEVTDDELEALIDAELAGVSLSTGDDEPGEDDLELSDELEDDDALDLAAGMVGVITNERKVTADTFTDETAGMRFELAASRLVRKGVPPHLIDLAAPILALSDDDAGAIDLASPVDGAAVDVRGVVRDMLEAAAGTIDLSSESGYGHETEPDEQVQSLASAWTEYLENN